MTFKEKLAQFERGEIDLAAIKEAFKVCDCCEENDIKTHVVHGWMMTGPHSSHSVHGDVMCEYCIDMKMSREGLSIDYVDVDQDDDDGADDYDTHMRFECRQSNFI